LINKNIDIYIVNEIINADIKNIKLEYFQYLNTTNDIESEKK
jgi:hypothetical protein